MHLGRRIALPMLTAAALLAAGCGSGGGGGGGAADVSTGATGPGSTGAGTGSAMPRAPSPKAAKPAATRVIRAWSDALRKGRIERATDYFALPSIVQNNSPPVTIDERAEARAFNVSLPCGARLERAYRIGRYTAAVFRLTDRPGGDCGTGTGGEAATAFVIKRGKIREWRRLEDPPTGGEAPPQLPPPGTPQTTITGPRA